jgi:glycosyltransferase 2 family protein
LSLGRVFVLLLIGVFFNFDIPGGTGGDVVKVFYLLKETPGRRAHALLSVLVDRIIGLLGLALLSGFLIGTRWSWLTSTSNTAHLTWVGVIILIFTIGGIHFSWIVTKHGWVHKLPSRFPGRDKLADLALAYTLYGRAWRITLQSVGISIFAHVGYFAVFYCAAQSLAHPGTLLPTFSDLCTIMPIVNCITAMPISVGGLGARENLFMAFLGPLCGVTEGVATLASIIGYFLTFFWGLLGGLLYMFYRPTEHAPLREIETEVATLEHAVAEEEVAMEIAEEEKRS